MTIAFDASSSSAQGTTNLSWTHTPVGTPKGIAVGVFNGTATADQISGVTYGGVAMTRPTGAFTSDAIGEPSSVTIYFLGSGIPTGAQTVAVTVSGAGTKIGHCISVTAGADTQLAGNSPQLQQNNQANPSTTISSISGASFGFGCLVSGLNDPVSVTAGSGYTKTLSHDFGANSAHMEYQTTQQASGNNTIAFTQIDDDVAMVSIAIEEVGGAVATPFKPQVIFY